MKSLLLALTTLLSCAPVSMGVDAHNPTPYSPGKLEAIAWLYATDCAGVTPAYPFAWVRWSEVDSLTAIGWEPEGVIVGFAIPERAEVFVRRDARRNAGVLAHEVLHLLVPEDGHTGPTFARCDPMNVAAR